MDSKAIWKASEDSLIDYTIDEIRIMKNHDGTFSVYWNDFGQLSNEDFKTEEEAKEAKVLTFEILDCYFEPQTITFYRV